MSTFKPGNDAVSKILHALSDPEFRKSHPHEIDQAFQAMCGQATHLLPGELYRFTVPLNQGLMHRAVAGDGSVALSGVDNGRGRVILYPPYCVMCDDVELDQLGSVLAMAFHDERSELVVLHTDIFNKGGLWINYQGETWCEVSGFKPIQSLSKPRWSLRVWDERDGVYMAVNNDRQLAIIKEGQLFQMYTSNSNQTPPKLLGIFDGYHAVWHQGTVHYRGASTDGVTNPNQCVCEHPNGGIIVVGQMQEEDSTAAPWVGFSERLPSNEITISEEPGQLFAVDGEVWALIFGKRQKWHLKRLSDGVATEPIYTVTNIKWAAREFKTVSGALVVVTEPEDLLIFDLANGGMLSRSLYGIRQARRSHEGFIYSLTSGEFGGQHFFLGKSEKCPKSERISKSFDGHGIDFNDLVDLDSGHLAAVKLVGRGLASFLRWPN